MSNADKSRLDTLRTLIDKGEACYADTRWLIGIIDRYQAVAEAAVDHIAARTAFKESPNSSNARDKFFSEQTWLDAMKEAGMTR